jgi:hypothetical protein
VNAQQRLRSATEVKTGQIRGLSIAMRAEAESLGLLRRRESAVISAWADALDEIANGLTEAIAATDPKLLRKMLKLLGFGLLVVIPSATEGATGAFVEEWVTDRIATQAEDVATGLDQLEILSRDPAAWSGLSTPASSWPRDGDIPKEFREAAADPEDLDRLLSNLDSRARFAVESRWGLVDGQGKSMREIGEQLGITAIAAERLIRRAESILRHPHTISSIAADESVAVTTTAPDQPQRSPIDLLAQEFPGSELTDERAESGPTRDDGQ